MRALRRKVAGTATETVAYALVCAVVIVGSATVLRGPVLSAAQQAATDRATDAAPDQALDKDAVTALERMGAYLRTLKAFHVEAVTSSEDVLEDGQKVQFSGVTHLFARMPDRLLINVESDRRARTYIYDGKEFTLHARRANYYATAPAPPTIAQLADVLHAKFDVNLPLEDLFRWGGPESETAALTSAMFVGPSDIGGITSGHYAFRQDGLDWQVWIQLGDFPLPRKLVLTTMTDEARPQYMATFNWNLAPSFNDATFTFTPPKGAGRVKMAEATLAGRK